MADFIKTKLQAALALLGMVFALRPYITDIEKVGFVAFDVPVNLLHVLAGMAGLLAVSVHCFAFDMLRARPFSLVERLGNLSFGLAVLMLPAFGVSWGLTELAQHLATQYALPHWVTPAAAGGLVVAWFALAVAIRVRLGRQDRKHQFEALHETESAALRRAREMFDHSHYDLAVIEVWRGLEARLRRSLLSRGVHGHWDDWGQLRHAARAAGLLAKVPLTTLDALRQLWEKAVSVEPVTCDEAAEALATTKSLLATIPL
jgi:hypothetical protein